MAIVALALPAGGYGEAPYNPREHFVGKSEDASELKIRMNARPAANHLSVQVLQFFSNNPHHRMKASWDDRIVPFINHQGQTKFVLGQSGPIDWVHGWRSEEGFHGKYSIDGHEHPWHANQAEGFAPRDTEWSGSTDSEAYLIDFRLNQQLVESARLFSPFVIRDAQTDEVVARLDNEFGFSDRHRQFHWKAQLQSSKLSSIQGRLESENALHGQFTLNGDVHDWYAWLDRTAD